MRFAANNQVVAYVNGQQAFTFVDTTSIADIQNADDLLTFFVDDNATSGGESSAGRVARLRVYGEGRLLRKPWANDFSIRSAAAGMVAASEPSPTTPRSANRRGSSMSWARDAARYRSAQRQRAVAHANCRRGWRKPMTSSPRSLTLPRGLSIRLPIRLVALTDFDYDTRGD